MDLLEKERSVLNLYADNGGLFDNCEHLIFDDVWSTRFNKIKYQIIKFNHGRGKKSDTFLLENMLKKAGFTNKAISAELGELNYKIAKNVEEYVKDIFDEYSKRLLLPKLHSIYSELDSEVADVDSCMEGIKSVISDIESIKNNLAKDKSILEIHDETFSKLLLQQDSQQELMGYSTGLKELDRKSHGLKQEVILVLAPPGCGKSSLMVNIIKHVAVKQLKPVCIFSIEMPAEELMRNIWANTLEINSYGIRSAKLSDENLVKIKNFRKLIEKENLIIDDTSGITHQYVETKIRKMRRTIPIETVIVVVIDYIQLMDSVKEEFKGTSSEERLGLIANGLMKISKKYNVCMIELSQITRDKTNGGNNKPTLQSGKGSGALEANAVQCWSLYRPDYFEKDPIEDGMSTKGLCEINILKYRYGETGPFYTKFKGAFSAFENYDMNEGGIAKSNESDDVF